MSLNYSNGKFNPLCELNLGNLKFFQFHYKYINKILESTIINIFRKAKQNKIVIEFFIYLRENHLLMVGFIGIHMGQFPQDGNFGHFRGIF